jgi:3'(2'), 5'-bisphosphate nucleotidase
MTLCSRPTLDALVTLARAAGDAILEVYNGPFDVTLKGDDSPLTLADLRSHAIIAHGLALLAPNVPVISEEAAVPPLAVRAGWSRLWLVDPLDGTKEFVNRNGEFTVNIALVEGGVPILGILHVPLDGRTYFAASGVGAFRAQAGGQGCAIAVRKPLGSPRRVVGSRSHRGDRLGGLLEAIGPHDFRPLGSASKFGLVAEGAADLYPRIGPTSEWDTAAGQAIVEIAGGHVVDRDGNPLRYNQRESLLNGDFIVYADGSRPWHTLL